MHNHVIFHAWHGMAVKLKNGEITEDEYDQWRYNYPEFDTVTRRVNIPSQGLSGFIVENFKEKNNSPQ